MANASHDDSSVPTLLGVSSADNKTPAIVTVTNNKLDVNAAVDTTGLALETGGNLASIKTNTDRLAPESVIYHGTKTVPTGTAEAIASSQAISSVTIKALSTNTVAIYAGATGVTTSGFELLAGESMTLEIDDLAKLFVISGSASQVIRYIAV